MSTEPTANDPSATAPTAQKERGSSWRRALRLGRGLLTAAALVLLVLGMVGQVVRDRTVLLGILSYFPLLPMGLGAALFDLVCLGRCLPRPRFGLALLGLAVAGWSAWSLMGVGSGRMVCSGRIVRLLHWNVRWGGKPWSWSSVMADIQRHSPDIVVLSEAPHRWPGWTQLLENNGWSGVECENGPDEYWLQLVVCARWPVRREYHRAVRNGHVMSVIVEVPGRPFRLLVVDGESEPWLSRLPFLEDVADICRKEAVDMLAGDFNTPCRSVGFDAFAEVGGGYRLASRSAVGWRGTYPSFCPLYDIDHVWLRRAWVVYDCTLFGHPACDHRGQIVSFCWE